MHTGNNKQKKGHIPVLRTKHKSSVVLRRRGTRSYSA